MPANIVKPGEEEHWLRAKEQAKKQGHENDWPYITHIFMKMTHKKSLTKSAMPGIAKPGQEHVWEAAVRRARQVGRDRDYDYVMKLYREMTGWKSLNKSGLHGPSYLVNAQKFGVTRIPGQVPSRENIEMMRLAQQPPKPFSIARLMAHDEPRMTPGSIVSDLGMDLGQQKNWTKFLESTVNGATNEITLRQSILGKCRDEGMDSALRRAILQRSLSHWRGYRKSMVQLMKPEELFGKGETRGGTYHRRVPKQGGGFTYYYDEDKYKASKQAHTNGKDDAHNFVAGKVEKCIETAGKAGCGIDAFEDLVKKFGSKAVAKALKGGTGSKYTYKKGKFKLVDVAGGNEDALETLKKKKVKKGELFIIPENMGSVLQKAAGHKYISRKKDVKGNWVYTYPEDKKKHIVNAILDFLSISKRPLTAAGTARAFRISRPEAVNILADLSDAGKISYRATGETIEYTKIGAKEPVQKKPEPRAPKLEAVAKVSEAGNGGLKEQPTKFTIPHESPKEQLSLFDPPLKPTPMELATEAEAKVEEASIEAVQPEFVAKLAPDREVIIDPVEPKSVLESEVTPEQPTLEIPKAFTKKETTKVEVGEHVWGSAKDKWDKFNNSGQLEGLTPEEQLKVAKKANLLEIKSTDTLLGMGMSPGAIVMRRAIEKMIGATPPKNIHKQAGKIFTSETEMRQAYVDGMDFVAESLDNCKTTGDIGEFIGDWRYLSAGKKKLGEFKSSRAEHGIAEDTVIEDKSGSPPKQGWEERDKLKKEFHDAYSNQHWATGAEKRRLTKKVRAIEEQMMEARNGLRAQEVEGLAVQKLFLTPEERDQDMRISFGYNKDRHWVIETGYAVKYLLINQDLGATEWTTPYRRYGFALGNKIANLSLAKRSMDRKLPKQIEAAQSLALRMDTMLDGEEQLQTLEKYENKKIVRSAGKKKSYKWVREVTEEIDRVGGVPVMEGSSASGVMRETFGVQNIQFGTSLPESDAQAHLDGLNGGLADLADIMGVDFSTIGLKDRLSFGMAARKGGAYAAAHYETDKKIINLTRKAGGGCVAHEWGHALDYIMAEAHNSEGAKDRRDFRMSNGELEGLPQPVAEAMAGVMDSILYTAPINRESWDKYVERRDKVLTGERQKSPGGGWDLSSGMGGPPLLAQQEDREILRIAQTYRNYAGVEDAKYVLDCKALSPGSNGYHQRRSEQFAHCFEAFIEDTLQEKGRKSSYLVSDTQPIRETYVFRDKQAESRREHAQRYPQGEQRQRVNAAFKKLMTAIAGTKALEKSLQKLFIRAESRREHAQRYPQLDK